MVEQIKKQSEEYLSLLREYHALTKNWIFRCYGMGVAWTILLITSAMLMMLPVSRLYFTAKYHEYQAVKATIELARHIEKTDDFERRGIQTTIAQWNGWLAYWRTWNSVPIVEMYIPDDIEHLEEIK